MKICFLGDAPSIHIKRQAAWFAARGHEVHVISFDDAKIDHVAVHYFKYRVRHLPFSAVLSVPVDIGRIKKIITGIAPDIVNGQYLVHYGLYAVCTGFHPVVVTAWGSDVLVTPRQFFFVRPFIQYTLKKADLIICRTPFMKEEIIRLGADAGRIEIGFLGVDTKKFRPSLRSDQVRRGLGISEAVPLIISTRSLQSRYGVETLVKAVPLVLKEVSPALFIIAGEGEQRGHLEQLARNLGVSNSVRFTGNIPHDGMPQYLASAEIYVSTSPSDGVPNSLLEAMSSGLAPVVTDIAANRIWVKEGENGFFFPVRDHEALAVRIISLLKNRELITKFGNLSGQMVREKGEHEVQMANLEKLYQRLIERKR